MRRASPPEHQHQPAAAAVHRSAAHRAAAAAAASCDAEATAAAAAAGKLNQVPRGVSGHGRSDSTHSLVQEGAAGARRPRSAGQVGRGAAGASAAAADCPSSEKASAPKQPLALPRLDIHASAAVVSQPPQQQPFCGAPDNGSPGLTLQEIELLQVCPFF
jgi:hypothetical protein